MVAFGREEPIWWTLDLGVKASRDGARLAFRSNRTRDSAMRHHGPNDDTITTRRGHGHDDACTGPVEPIPFGD
jgi:hypothetical protein